MNPKGDPIGTAVNQPGKDPSSQNGSMPTMVPLQPNFPSLTVNPQFSQMFQQAPYNLISSNQRYLWNYNTQLPQNSIGYNPYQGISSYQAMASQLSSQPQQCGQISEKTIPVTDSKNKKNLVTANNRSEEGFARPHTEKSTENSESNICLQLASQIVAFLNDSGSDFGSKEPESVQRSSNSSHKNEEKGMQKTSAGELVDENVSDSQHMEGINDITESRNLIDKKEAVGSSNRNDIDSNTVNYCESDVTKSIDIEDKMKEKKLNDLEVPIESTVPDIEECVKSEEKTLSFIKTKKVNNAKFSIDSSGSKSTQESVQSVIGGAKEFVLPSGKTESCCCVCSKRKKDSENSDANICLQLTTQLAAFLNDSTCDVTFKQNESVIAVVASLLMLLREKQRKNTSASSAPSVFPATSASHSPVSTPVSERNLSVAPITDNEILNANPTAGGNVFATFRNDLSSNQQTSDSSSFLSSEDDEDQKDTGEPQENKKILKCSCKKGQARVGQKSPIDHKEPFEHTTLHSVASNSGHDTNKPANTAKEGMHSNAGMPTPAKNLQLTKEQIAILQSRIKLKQPISINPITLQMAAAYYPRNSVPPQTIQNVTRNPIGAVVNQPGQQPSEYGPVPTMVPLQHNFTSFPSAMVNPQFPQMYQQRAYSAPPYTFMASQQYLWNYNTPPPQNTNGYFPSHGMSSYKSIPIVDPKTGKNVLTADKKSEDRSRCPNCDKETKHSDSNICVQFATEVASILNDRRNDIASIQPESIRINNKCSHENEGIEMEETQVDVLDVEFNGSKNSMCNKEIARPYHNNIIDSSSINESESGTTKNIDLESKSEDKGQNAFEIPLKLSVSDSTKYVKSETLNFISNSEKILVSNETEKINDVKSKSPDCSNITQESMKPFLSDVKDLLLPRNNEVLDSSSTTKIPEKVLFEGKKNKAKKKKDLSKRGESKIVGKMDVSLDAKEGAAALSLVPLPKPTAAPSSVSIPVSEENASPKLVVASETLNPIPKSAEKPNTTSQTDISPCEQTSETSAVSVKANGSQQHKIVLKLNYKEDQWSPLNPEGKKQYHREFLLQLQTQPLSLCKPNNLPNLDVIKDKVHIQKLPEVNRTPSPVVNNPPVNRSQGKNSQKLKLISEDQNIKLHKSSNPWRPLHKCEKPLHEKDRLKRSVLGVLNKLTPQKFETLLAQLKSLRIDTEEKLSLVTDLVFEKAVFEPMFSAIYAKLSKHLALIKVPASGATGTQINFRKLMLTKCQTEFEQDKSYGLEEKLKNLKAVDPVQRKKLQLEYDEEERKVRHRKLGIVRFFGELFKLKMLIEPIMHELIKLFLRRSNDESLEYLSRLFKTIGKEFDNKKTKKKHQMDKYFDQMKIIVSKRMTSSRVRFLLQDVIDLKKNNWLPRRPENTPKTIDEIHEEAAREAHDQQLSQNVTFKRKSTGGIDSPDHGRTSESNKNYNRITNPSKLKLTKLDEIEKIRLGPVGRCLQTLDRDISSDIKTTDDSDKTACANKFSDLAEQSLSSNFEEKRASQSFTASNPESSQVCNRECPPEMSKAPSSVKERENLLEIVDCSSRASEDKALQVKSTVEVEVNGKAAVTKGRKSVVNRFLVLESALNGPQYNKDDIQRETKSIIDKFLHNNEFEEAIKCITKLASPNTVHMFIDAAINQVLERPSQARYSLGQLLSSLLEKEIITFEQYKKGFVGVLESINNYSLSIPLIWECMGEILEPMIENIETPFKLLKEVLQPCIPSENAGMLVSSILHYAAKRKGTKNIVEAWRKSDVQWSDIIGTEGNVDEFIEKYKLEFTVSPTKVNLQTQLSMEEMKKHLSSLLEKNAKLEEIFDWIDDNISDTCNPTFVRALVTAIHESCLSGSGTSWELNTSKLKSKMPLISRYVSTNKKLQLQALYALQALMNQLGHPYGLLQQIFDGLHDDVISYDTFLEWKQSDDPSEAEAKDIAVRSVKSFFPVLRELEETEGLNSV